MAYILDSNVFIQASNLHYGFDFCPAFRDWLDIANSDSLVYSIQEVYVELQGRDDVLAGWAKQRHEKFFRDMDQSTLSALGRIITWVQVEKYASSAIDIFKRVADSALIARALAHGDTVVTHEILSGSKRNIKIPDVCVGVGVKYVDTHAMLKLEKAKFVLG